MEELQTELDELLKLREEYMKCGRKDEPINDEIRELQRQIRELKS